MAEPATRTMILRYVDDRVERYEFPVREDQFNIISLLEEAFKSPVLILALQDRTLLVPISSLKSIEFHPAAERLPRIAIRGARAV